MRCLLIEHPDGLVLVDTGAGDKETEKFHGIYGIENAAVGAVGPTQLESALAEAGFAAADVSTGDQQPPALRPCGRQHPARRRWAARAQLSQRPLRRRRGEWEWAHHTNERTAASYFAHNYDPVQAAGRLDLVDDDAEILPGISVRHTPGHTPHHQGILVESGAERLFYLADLAPTTAHVPLPWIMGYDVEPLVTLETKRRIWAEAASERWLVMFEHDATNAFGRIVSDGKGYVCEVED